MEQVCRNKDLKIPKKIELVENKVIFTDGEATMPDIALDVIWVVFSNKKIN